MSGGLIEAIYEAAFVPELWPGTTGSACGEFQLIVADAEPRPLKDAASDLTITVKTGCTYLERIFAKTGTRQQSQLAALVKNAELVAQPTRHK
ncbi:hypothetical protein EN904_07725 [Mesorhizobium sp. M7A.F.Ca.CA.001.07.2.1]|jgi:hypothetical protein|uniref:hypothetical protein n=1 Tax=Mesorhizobium TaxID=68287 RepID=UPI000FCA3167|nr:MULTISPECIES: hypothetical protein [Mesorhizobium]MCF6125501.1 hypothetical protein [Mesorhizobium ciceri]MCQ8816002.1 hypothetical protein [Mesorhizobium sp. SEMIA396]RUX71937.1 hypothetical protein EN983_22825 [Mesorhizobium sp. M7A.F.Ca.CA.004.08.2.1]RUX79863.1 hypothetical protein EN982_33890 [Mesorhizobium sp. M7A.F.Ca.CA.004.08.1.1]RUY14297.1 hypothetical protein EN984_33275 [Mesorhizobium sp. M7A.F.Ca.CA.004.12.1.1]